MTDWAAVHASDFAVPERPPLAELVDELCAMLASPDPQVRDDTAYPVLAMWIARGVLDGQLAALGDRLVERFGHDEIQARTFAPMILAWVVLRDAETGELAADRVPRWLALFAAWWLGETDLRGWDAGLGWLHAVAHGADALRAFSRSPRLDADDLRGLLETAVDRLLTDSGYLFAQDEDDRIGHALASVLSRVELSADSATAWLGRLRSALEAGEPGPMPAWASNTLRTLSSVYVFADRGMRRHDPDTGGLISVMTLPHSAAVKEQIAPILRLAWRGLN